jgi:hypothetical protein
MTKSLEDFRVSLDRVAMAAKWVENLKHAWECKGTAACRALLKEADDPLERALEQEATETRLKKLEDGRNKLMNLADTMHLEIKD